MLNALTGHIPWVYNWHREVHDSRSYITQNLDNTEHITGELKGRKHADLDTKYYIRHRQRVESRKIFSTQRVFNSLWELTAVVMNLHVP
jgi:hypothetical protein